MGELWEKIACAHDWSGHQLREKRNRENEIAERSRRLQHATINIERIRKGMESVKGNADREQNVEMRRLIDDADSREQPLEILKEEISVFEKTEHAQVHAHARDQPSFLVIFGFTYLPTEPEIHCGGRKQKRGKGRVPGAVKDVARDNEQIFPQLPTAEAPVESDDNYEKDNESERVKKHGKSFDLRCRRQQPIYASHIEADVLEVVFLSGKIDIRFL